MDACLDHDYVSAGVNMYQVSAEPGGCPVVSGHLHFPPLTAGGAVGS